MSARIIFLPRAQRFCSSLADVLDTRLDISFTRVSAMLTAQALAQETSFDQSHSIALALRASDDLHRIVLERAIARNSEPSL